MSTEIVPVQEQQNIGLQFVMSAAEARRQLVQLREFVTAAMEKGVDYGEIPGIERPTLLKPGAEKLCEIYGFAIAVEMRQRIEDWKEPFFHYEVLVTLTNKRTGHLVAQGVGSCNSREKNYWIKEPCRFVNTILKMAKKRALVDAVLSATRSSGIFTQDIEDLADVIDVKPGKLNKPAAKPAVNDPNRPLDVNKFWAQMDEFGLDDLEVLEVTNGIPPEQMEPKALRDLMPAFRALAEAKRQKVGGAQDGQPAN